MPNEVPNEMPNGVPNEVRNKASDRMLNKHDDVANGVLSLLDKMKLISDRVELLQLKNRVSCTKSVR